MTDTPENPDVDDTTATSSDGEITVTYRETESERLLFFETGGHEATVAQNLDGYAMLKVRDGTGDERERYYGLDMALDHAAELLGVSPHDLPVPDAAGDMGM